MIKRGFTLAEVLITLGIIGVVTALTIPNVTSHYRKKVVETRLAKFYSVMNQAVQMSEKDNGPKEYWEHLGVKDEDENAEKGEILPEVWFDKYLKPYLKYSSVKVNDVTGRVMVYFPDGSLALIGGESIHFWPDAGSFVEYNGEADTSAGESRNNYQYSGTKYFTFLFRPWAESMKYHYKKGVEPYKAYSWDGTVEMLKTHSAVGCKETVSNERAFCAAWIQQNGWKIPDDYPLKF